MLLIGSIAGAANKETKDEPAAGTSVARKGNQLTITAPPSSLSEHSFQWHADNDGCAQGRIEIGFSQGRVTLKEGPERPKPYYRMEGHSSAGFLITVGSPECQVTIEVRPKR